MTEETLGKLREAYLMGCTDREACLFADIHPDTLYAFQHQNEEYSEQKRVWQSNPVLRARMAVMEFLQFDAKLAMRYLERRLPEEFGTRKEPDLSYKESQKITNLAQLLDDAEPDDQADLAGQEA